MTNQLIAHIQQDSQLDKILKQSNVLVTGLGKSAKAAHIAAIYQQQPRPMIIVTSNLLHAQKLAEDLLCLIPQVWIYGAEELIMSQMVTKSPEAMYTRINVINRLLLSEAGIYLIPLAGLYQLLPTKSQWQQSQLVLQLGETLDVSQLASQLVTMGYERTDHVDTLGQFSLRGGICDIFAPFHPQPIRIEFFDDEIDSMRFFDETSQRSIKNIEQVTISPANDYLLNDDMMTKIIKRLTSHQQHTIINFDAEVQQMAAKHFDNLMHQVNDLGQRQVLLPYLSYGYSQLTTIQNYFPKNSVIILDEPSRLMNIDQTYQIQSQEWLVTMMSQGEAYADQQIIASDCLKTLIQSSLTKYYYAHLTTRLDMPIDEHISYKYIEGQNLFGKYDLLLAELEYYLTHDYYVNIQLATPHAQKNLVQILEDMQFTSYRLDEGDSGIVITVGDVLSQGFSLPYAKVAIITEQAIFNQSTRKKRRASSHSNYSNAEKIKSYQELNVGDYVVHTANGIGKYLGVETLERQGIHSDYIKIQYQGTDVLYVPVNQMSNVLKYTGATEGVAPKLYKLGGTEWQKTKRKVQQSVDDIADELIKIYSAREKAQGYAFSADTVEQRDFEADFPYEPTEDQLRSVQEIKQDMERARPMDRLLCGDVGFGKTEVALRAAFKAVMDGKQVAILVPTTILAQQHYESLIERIGQFPVNVALMSRFRTKQQQQQDLEMLAKGQVDIIVGTHRLLSDDVKYKDLGLLIIDEEQRFGVRHKEKLKALKANVDVLTLTATPIPRTLHMSLIGIRDLSVIETPPSERYPVQTYVMGFHATFIAEAIMRELARGGQVFYLFNSVEHIEMKRAELMALLPPDTVVEIAHGQMTERQLERVMLDFIEGNIDVLVTTTIIETGVDVPNANTLIIENADRFGLSQLYQLRGRIGRSNRIAYAYFTYPKDKLLSEVAEQRLQAIKEFTSLGSGFKIAMRDLSIRGTGNLLGKQQHGFIDAVGYDLYAQMLEQAIDQRKEDISEAPEITTPKLDMKLHVDAYIPSSYISSQQQKIEIYQRLQNITTLYDLHECRDELLDRYGNYPQAVADLLAIVELKIAALLLGVNQIKEQDKSVIFTISEANANQLDGSKLFEASLAFGRQLKIDYKDKQFILQCTKQGKYWLAPMVKQLDVLVASQSEG